MCVLVCLYSFTYVRMCWYAHMEVDMFVFILALVQVWALGSRKLDISPPEVLHSFPRKLSIRPHGWAWKFRIRPPPGSYVFVPWGPLLTSAEYLLTY